LPPLTPPIVFGKIADYGPLHDLSTPDAEDKDVPLKNSPTSDILVPDVSFSGRQARQDCSIDLARLFLILPPATPAGGTHLFATT